MSSSITRKPNDTSKLQGQGRQIKMDAFWKMNAVNHPYYVRKEGILSSQKNDKQRIYIFDLKSLAMFNKPIIQMYRILRPTHKETNQQILRQINQQNLLRKYPKHNRRDILFSIHMVRDDIINGEKFSSLLMEFIFVNVRNSLKNANIKTISQLSYEIFGRDYSNDYRDPQYMTILQQHQREIVFEINKHLTKTWDEVRKFYSQPTYSTSQIQNQTYKNFYRNNLLVKLQPLTSKQRIEKLYQLIVRSKNLWTIDLFITNNEQKKFITAIPYEPYSKENIKDYMTLADYFVMKAKIKEQRKKLQITTNNIQETKEFGRQIISQLIKYHENQKSVSYYYKWLCPENIMYENGKYFLSFMPPILECLGLDKMPLSQEMMNICHTPQMHPDYYFTKPQLQLNNLQSQIRKFLILIDQFQHNVNMFQSHYTQFMVDQHSHLLFDIVEKIQQKPQQHKVLKEIFLKMYRKIYREEPKLQQDKNISQKKKSQQATNELKPDRRKSDAPVKIYKIKRQQFEKKFWEHVNLKWLLQFLSSKQQIKQPSSQSEQFGFYQLMEKFASSLQKQLKKQAILTYAQPIKLQLLRVYLLIICLITVELQKKQCKNQKYLLNLEEFSVQYKQSLNNIIQKIKDKRFTFKKQEKVSIAIQKSIQITQNIIREPQKQLVNAKLALYQIFEVTCELEKSYLINPDRVSYFFFKALILGELEKQDQLQQVYKFYKSFKKQLSVEELQGKLKDLQKQII